MRVIFTKNAWEEYLSWQVEDKRMLRKINSLIRAIPQAPHTGIGKPEPLVDDLAGLWSRRIEREHRLVYGITGVDILVYSCRFHFEKT